MGAIVSEMCHNWLWPIFKGHSGYVKLIYLIFSLMKNCKWTVPILIRKLRGDTIVSPHFLFFVLHFSTSVFDFLNYKCKTHFSSPWFPKKKPLLALLVDLKALYVDLKALHVNLKWNYIIQTASKLSQHQGRLLDAPLQVSSPYWTTVVQEGEGTCRGVPRKLPWFFFWKISSWNHVMALM